MANSSDRDLSLAKTTEKINELLPDLLPTLTRQVMVISLAGKRKNQEKSSLPTMNREEWCEFVNLVWRKGTGKCGEKT